MKRTRIILIYLLTGVMLMISLGGCFGKKYKVMHDGGFSSKKTAYRAGEKVTLYYEFIATDTDYSFYSNDVELKQSYDNDHGYVFTFTMPEHDVLVQSYSKNSMVWDPNANREETEEDWIAQIKNGACEMVFDYYEATVGTVGGDGHDEFVLYRRPNGVMLMAKFSQWGDAAESCRACIMTDSALYDCLELVDKNNMRKWNEQDGLAITGAAYVVKFREADRTVRVSSENMPEDGRKAFGEIEQVLSKAWRIYGPKK